MLVIAEGPALTYIGGYSPSAPSLCKIVPVDAPTECVIEKAPQGTSNMIYSQAGRIHMLRKDGVNLPEIRIFDYIHPDKCVFIRYFTAMRTASFRLVPRDGVSVCYYDSYYPGSVSVRCLVLTPPKDVYYPEGDGDLRMYIILSGELKYNSDLLLIRNGIGYGEILISFGRPDTAASVISSAFRKTEFDNPLIPKPQNPIYKGTVSRWEKYCASSESHRDIPVSSAEYSDEINSLYEACSERLYNLRAESGAFLCDMEASLQSVCDMCIIAEALLYDGCFDEVCNLLEFFYGIWLNKGCVPLFVSTDGIRSKGGTGCYNLAAPFILNTFFHYAEATGDTSYLIRRFDLLSWAFGVQSAALAGGSLPFCGYEPYFLRGKLPHKARFHGSSLSTMLFITSGKRYAAFAESASLVGKKQLECCKHDILYAESCFRDNFVVSPGLSVNCPKREIYIKRPHTVYGFCDLCRYKGSEPEEFKNFSDTREGWLERTRTGFYACPQCYNKRLPGTLSPYENNMRIYEVEIPLLCFHYDCNIIPGNELAATVLPFIADIRTLSIRELALLLPFAASFFPARFDEVFNELFMRLDLCIDIIGPTELATFTSCVKKAVAVREKLSPK